MGKPWKDTAVWNISELTLPYNENLVALNIGVTGAAKNIDYNYEYRLEGLEPDWIMTLGLDYIRYVLSPGTYTFKARICNARKDLSKETKIIITI